jgi:hypothetical protein
VGRAPVRAHTFNTGKLPLIPREALHEYVWICSVDFTTLRAALDEIMKNNGLLYPVAFFGVKLNASGEWFAFVEHFCKNAGLIKLAYLLYSPGENPTRF